MPQIRGELVSPERHGAGVPARAQWWVGEQGSVRLVHMNKLRRCMPLAMLRRCLAREEGNLV
jgi:hypothetical protein